MMSTQPDARPVPVDPPGVVRSPAFAQGMLLPAGPTLYVGGQLAIRIFRKPRDHRIEKRALSPRRRELLDQEQIVAALERANGRRHHADHRVLGAIEANRLADGIGTSAKALLPERVAGQRDLWSAKAAVGFAEISAHHRVDAEHREKRP